VSEPPLPPQAGEPSSAICERHRLRFDPRTQSGCVLCRKEAGATTRERAGGRRSDSVGPGWLLAALLWLLSGLALSALHASLLASFSAFAPAPVPQSATVEPEADFEQDVDSGFDALRRDSADADPGWSAAADEDGEGPDYPLDDETDRSDSP